MIHRDLKPANILVGAFGETVVIDWGLAKNLAVAADEPALDGSPYRAGDGGSISADATAHGKVMGTPAYMPLEQARGEPVDERADVYALGAILYHVLAGRPPYRAADETSVPWETMLARVIAGTPTPLAAKVATMDGIDAASWKRIEYARLKYAQTLELVHDPGARAAYVSARDAWKRIPESELTDDYRANGKRIEERLRILT